ncbi:hypothetical protein EJ05DRAFT_510967 [Pseudovirgaria hyperparasitica]|uniref:ABM domain-containing protein n=1 Tax=Pseudovirgaria hyperparasitica TaxID=470096 RepID=A0A6A6WAJ6_9PEZI|nr:uncharacterized protein EJ05DRAFT_510967 [Pseudovirgaria hyperparasitica]KAF2758141.1 hypothetical protein EJ05DRAFT_510967 [Pseudovirgaria hyperparasitica]
MSPATQIAYFTLKSRTNVNEGEAEPVFTTFLKTISSQPGLQSLYYGHTIQHPDILQLLVQWRTIEDHHTYMQTSDYPALIDTIRPYLKDVPVYMFHVHFPLSIDDLCSKPVVEVVSMYVTHAQAPFYESNLAVMLSVLAEAEGNYGSISGHAVEEAEHESFGADGKGARFVSLIGWTGIAAHEAFKKHPAFSRHADLFAELVVGAEMHHITLRRFGKA